MKLPNSIHSTGTIKCLSEALEINAQIRVKSLRGSTPKGTTSLTPETPTSQNSFGNSKETANA